MMRTSRDQSQPLRTHLRRARAAAIALSLLAPAALTTACVDDGAPGDGGLAIHFAALAAGGCQATSNGRNTVPDDIDKLTAAIDVAGFATRYERASRAAVAKAGQWVIKDILADTLTDVRVIGCAGGEAIWAGRSNGLSVEDQLETSAHVFLAPVGALGCTGSEATNASAGESDHLAAGRSMATATALASGDVVVAGGVGAWSGSGDGVATRDVDVYDHRAGHFRKGPQLLEARVWHHALAIDADHVLVAGGVTNLARIGDASLPSALLMPKAPKAAKPKQVAVELIALQSGSGKASASPADVGTGSRLLSSSLRIGDELVFVGGVDDSGAAVKDVTVLGDLAAIAAGEAGTTTTAALNVARARPALLRLHDGSLLVWGGQASGKATDLGERRKPDGTFQVLAVDGDKDLLASDTIATVGPAVASLGVHGGVEILVVSGGATGALSTADVPSYAVRVDVGAGKATLRAIKLPAGVALAGGVAGVGVSYGEGEALFSGGLISISGGAPCAASDAECIIADVTRVAIDGDAGADPLALSAASIGTLGGRRFGVAAAAVPAGVLLAGGQSSVVEAGAAPDVLDPTGRLVAAPPATSEAAAICN